MDTNLIGYGEKRMTVKEVAEALGVSDRVVQLSIKRLYPEAVANGKTTRLDESQATAIKQDLQGHHNLEGTFEAVHTDLEMARKAQEVMAWMAGKVNDLEAQLANAQPKVEFFDAICESKDTIEMGNVAKILNIPEYGRNKLFAFLRDKKILMRGNIPYQDYINRGYFRVIETSWIDKGGASHPVSKTMVYQKGMDFIRNTIMGRP